MFLPLYNTNSSTLQQILGQHRRAPKWAIAYKFPPDEVITDLYDIHIQVGRTGLLTPVAILKPVTIGGVEVARATLHNEDEVNRLGLGAYVTQRRGSSMSSVGGSSGAVGSRGSVRGSGGGTAVDTSDVDVPESYLATDAAVKEVEKEEVLNREALCRVVVKRAGDVIPKIVRTLPPLVLSSSLDTSTSATAISTVTMTTAVSDTVGPAFATDSSTLSIAVSEADVDSTIRAAAPTTTADPTTSTQYKLPSACPVCGSPTEREPGGVGVRCTGDTATATAIQYKLPSACPVCGSPTEREPGGVGVRCTGGMTCSAQAVESLR